MTCNEKQYLQSLSTMFAPHVRCHARVGSVLGGAPNLPPSQNLVAVNTLDHAKITLKYEVCNQSLVWLNPTFYHLKMIPPRASRFSPRHDEWLSNKPRSLTNTLQKYFSFFKICLLTILFHIHSYCKVEYCFWTDPDFKSRRHNTFCLLFRELSIYRLLIQEARNDSRENCLDIKFLLSGLWFPYSSKNCQ